MQSVWSLLCLALTLPAWSLDLSPKFQRYYQATQRFSQKDLSFLSQKDIILVPGILSEVFSHEDERGRIDFSRLTSDYFAAQMTHLKYNLQLPTKKLLSSSKDVSETTKLIAQALKESQINNREVIFITHSLGGLALLDHLLVSNEAEWESVAGIIFLQTPFYGSPIADVYLDNPYHADKWLRPFLPFFHTSEATVKYLSMDHRIRFMQENRERIKDIFQKIPILTMSGVTNGYKSLFTPAADLLEHGCLLNALGRCFTRILWEGKRDQSDGMVPLFSSRFEKEDFVVIEGADHGEPIVRLPFQEISKEIMTEALMKLLLDKIY